MTRGPVRFIAVLGLLAALTAAGCAAGQPVPPMGSEITSAQVAAASDLITSKCTGCHSTDRIAMSRKSPEQWQATVDRMVDRGARLTRNERVRIIQFLSKVRGF